MSIPFVLTGLDSGNVQGFNKLETEFLAEEIFDDGCYLKPGLIHLQAGDTVIDVGSNIGIFGVQAAQIVGASGRVISIEALPPTFDKLQQNRKDALQRGHASAEWIAINAAAGASNGNIDMTFFPRAAGWGTSDPEHHRERMTADLNVFIRSLLQDETSKVLLNQTQDCYCLGEPCFTLPPRSNLHHSYENKQAADLKYAVS